MQSEQERNPTVLKVTNKTSRFSLGHSLVVSPDSIKKQNIPAKESEGPLRD